MKPHRHRDDTINAWWERVPGERYWLDVTGRDDWDEYLATPRGAGMRSAPWAPRLISHVRGGDIVFHYDASQAAIVAWSVSSGRLEKRDLSWPLPARVPGVAASSRSVPSWGIRLRQSTKLAAPVPLSEIARAQWSLFPSLRALEDEVGDPLHYPFEMGNRDATRPLSGYVLKLPALLVRELPELAGTIGSAPRLTLAEQRAWAPTGPPTIRLVPASQRAMK